MRVGALLEGIKNKNIISKVFAGSIAEEVGIEAGDFLLSINGEKIEDIIEYRFYMSDEYLEVAIEKQDGELWEIEIEKDYDEDLGIEFENPIISEAKSCKNKCIFCFIDQLPKNMRETLYFKDDDSRLSFLTGNYITLTNMKSEDIDKIIKYRISPINISVHTTNSKLREKMLNNRHAGDILSIIHRFAENGIYMNCQIVLCPDVNDKKELDNTIKDLGHYSNFIQSLAIVPVGLTKYREGLFKLRAFEKEEALKIIEQIEGFQKKFKQETGRNFVYLGDEFYLLANKAFPIYEDYDHFTQLENGVGLVTKFKKTFYDYLATIEKKELIKSKKITVVTGDLAFNIIESLTKDLVEKIEDVEIQVIPIKNNYFGGHVNVSGLVTGTDIIDTLEGKDLGEKVIIPESMLKSGETIFLDNVTIEDIENKLKTRISVSEVDGSSFIKEILRNESEERGAGYA
ncbi:DUF512 domain-containing protein [Serpentinicella sp. ANB-PHB4]|uniref:DUF512 domain-containing protein n=1 Tax=Serpentinicella sp. ANB-PHB4 TaxID=3074076 RepID=UPI00285FBCB8|nr:DUF512 domain-containing protein [Serpentinicella sp. ANB-PHB4]MDR5657913.1 DUF512 domain-containing protein [Serpentinicella sp. ANB-PHB4]